MKIRLAMKAIFGLTNCYRIKVTKRLTRSEKYFVYTIEFWNKIPNQ